jgi:hypothetical protein
MQIEGIPDGWEFVRVGRCHPGEVRVDTDGKPAEWNSVASISANYVIIRKIEKSKKYREPVAEDLKDGPIDVECCTPDPDSGSEKWRTRRLISILPADYKNRFLVDHPKNQGIVLRYKKARIECNGSRRAALRKILICRDGKHDLLELIGIEVCTPVSGMGIGEQLGYYSKTVDKGCGA